MKRAILLLALIWPSIGLSGFYDGNRVLELCEGDINEKTVCLSYLLGVIDATLDKGPNAVKFTKLMMPNVKEEGARDMFVENIKHQYCIPDNVTSGQIQRVFVKWARETPEKLHEPAAELAQKAFAKAWPCKL